MTSNAATVVILTALRVEFSAVRQHLSEIAIRQGPQGAVYEFGYLEDLDRQISVALAETGAGNIDAALHAQLAVTHFRPRYVFFVGVAGGLKDVSLGDVVAATKVYGYESGKAEHTFRARPNMGESAFEIVQVARKVARDDAWQKRIRECSPYSQRAFIGPIAAGEKVVASESSTTARLLREHYSDALAIEMEGFGLLRAGYLSPETRFAVIRGISDLLDNKMEADARGSQEAASDHAAAFAIEVISQLASLKDPAVRPGAFNWIELEQEVTRLYPLGLTQSQVWSRAGGDLSSVENLPTGKATWHAALRQLRLGGGGADITLSKLLGVIREDFPNNSAIARLSEQAGSLASD